MEWSEVVVAVSGEWAGVWVVCRRGHADGERCCEWVGWGWAVVGRDALVVVFGWLLAVVSWQ